MNSKRINLKDGITIFYSNTEEKFKTNFIGINIISKLERNSITKNALIPLVLRRGTAKYPTMKEISIKLEEMYGASFGADSDKLGNRLITTFNIDMISNQYTLEKEDLFKECAELICDVLLNPSLENGAFNTEYVRQEKDSLREMIESKINYKTMYAAERAVEEMYNGEPYGLYKYGYVEDLDSINADNLYAQYKELISKSEIQIYVSGNVDENEMMEIFNNAFANVERDYQIIEDNEDAESKSFREVIERQNVIQGKLVLGYYLKDFNPIEDFYKMTVYSAILGGTASSKLFCNVREKKSLAYTIRSQYIKHKGAMFVSAGIELDNYELAKECIFKEINDMKIGEITEEEIHDAKVNLTTRFKSFNDSQTALAGWAFGQNLLGGEEDLELVIQKIKAVSKEEIVEVASRLELVLAYYLCA